MKTKLLLLVALFATFTASAQLTEVYPSYLQVNGSAEREVAPDEIYLSITINERDSKGRSSVEEQQRAMLSALKGLGIKTDEQLRMVDLGSAFFKKNSNLATARYTLRLGSASEVAAAWQALDRLGISQVSVERVAHSQIARYEGEVRAAAMRDAQSKARELAEAVGQSVGRCFYIYDLSGGAVVGYGTAVKMARSSNADQSSFGDEVAAEGLEFQKIKLQYRVQAKFVLE